MSNNDVYEPVESVSVSPKSDSDRIPPSKDICASPDESENAALSGTVVTGKSNIIKTSSSSVIVSGFTQCTPSDPAARVVLRLQSYYDGAWHTLATKSKQQSGTRVELSQAYNVTSGFYYRTSGTHSAANGSTVYTTTAGMLVN